MTPDKKKMTLFGVVAAVTIILDQWTKVLAREHLAPLGRYATKEVIPGYFDLRYSENPGIAFGVAQDLPAGRYILALVAVAAVLLVIFYLRRTDNRHRRLHFALGLVGGGAVGNLIDRVIYGHVSDFIVWRIDRHEWPAFNIADAALVVGVCLMALDMLPWGRRGTEQAKA